MGIKIELGLKISSDGRQERPTDLLGKNPNRPRNLLIGRASGGI
ncbi:hypothetical protein [Pontibacter sp. G13]|nr:hypothetical protein [Pontibacter sp. G13]WNJ19158.1 hypothetical protein RJD25_01590 [Pontibacter sp. G13]